MEPKHVLLVDGLAPPPSARHVCVCVGVCVCVRVCARVRVRARARLCLPTCLTDFFLTCVCVRVIYRTFGMPVSQQ